MTSRPSGKTTLRWPRSRNNLGEAYRALGEYRKAIGYFEQALESDLKTYGEDHPNVARDRNNLGSAYDSLGEYKKAMGYYEQALASGLKTYGGRPPLRWPRTATTWAWCMTP